MRFLGEQGAAWRQEQLSRRFNSPGSRQSAARPISLSQRVHSQRSEKHFSTTRRGIRLFLLGFGHGEGAKAGAAHGPLTRGVVALNRALNPRPLWAMGVLIVRGSGGDGVRQS